MIKIAFTGDVGFSSKYFKGSYDKEGLLDKELFDYLKDTDCTVVNVEGCVTDAEPSANKTLLHANPTACILF